ncbi:uncharacterized protein LOC128958871 [Oppia nitens]|uniref:uncharacterized protein LOC128958871 n=1 Tax=Oppia nitens TaxID=1686743 RepID=UPI0023DB51DC|nr:uncharacterized protein LOC128958871 [Oppia nitens]
MFNNWYYCEFVINLLYCLYWDFVHNIVSDCCLRLYTKDFYNYETHEMTPIVVYTEDKIIDDFIYYNSNYKESDKTVKVVLISDDKELNEILLKDVNLMINAYDMMRSVKISKDLRLRQKQYTMKVSAINKPLLLRSQLTKDKITSVSIEERVNQMTRISDNEIQLIDKYSRLVSDAVKNGFKIQCNDPIIVPFEP